MVDVYLRNLLKILGVGAGFASIPLMLSFASLEPPWPPAIGYVSSALVLVSALIVWEWTRSAARISRRKWIASATILTLLGLFGYLTLYSLFIEKVPGADARVIRGFTCTREASLVYGMICPDLPRDALLNAEWEAPLLWTRESITVVRVLLTITWLSFIAGLIARAVSDQSASYPAAAK